MKIANDLCIGCGICTLICPQKCISMKSNKIGRLEPNVNIDACVHCGLCIQKCPQNSVSPINAPQNCYVAWSKDPKDWIFSASGGVGAAIASYQVEHNGFICGCDYDNNGELLHYCTSEKDKADCFRSSKYSQSNCLDAYKNIKYHLEANKHVVFIGTPCQCAALSNYISNKENLIIVDLVCHGTPPNKYLIEHIKHIKKKNFIEKIRFRGEYDQKLSLWSNGKIFYQKSNTEDKYFRAFYANIISYEACYYCKYARSERISDISIGDFWGLGQLNLITSRSERPSLILINTKKGKEFFDKFKYKLFFEERDVSEGIVGNGRLNAPPGKNKYAKVFEKLYSTFGFENSVRIAFVLQTITQLMVGFLKTKKERHGKDNDT